MIWEVDFAMVEEGEACENHDCSHEQANLGHGESRRVWFISVWVIGQIQQTLSL